MRKSKIITIDGVGEVVLKEVSPVALYRAITADNRVTALWAIADECISLDRERLEGLYASELEQLVDGLKEVNASFFTVADKVGVASSVRATLGDLVESLPPLFVGLFRRGMLEPGTTGGSVS